MNVSLHFFNTLTRAAESYISFHSHNGFELVYYASGTGVTQIDGEKYEYEAGQFAIIEPGCLHDEYRFTTTDVMFFVFYCDSQLIRLENGIYRDTDKGVIRNLLERMRSELAGKSKYYDLMLRSLLTEVVVEIVRMSPAEREREPDGHLVYAKNYIEQYHGDKIDLQGLAKTLGYSYDYFRHLFKTYTGYSPMQYAVQQRLERAKRMLTESGEPITAISSDCGFSNSPQFCMMFKKQFGVSPKRYRDLHGQ